MEVNHMETTMNDILPDTNAPVDEAPQPDATARPARRAGRLGDDVVRWAEFRLAVWMGGFALAVIISSQGFLYSAILGLKDDIGYLGAEMQRLNGELRVDMQTQTDDLRLDMQTQFGKLRVEMQELRVEMQTQFAEQRERTVRIETHLGIDTDAAYKGN
ncbi:MAG: hypothetical protein OXN26_05890 [Gammaproteobacteria bacterium]|nr:hypothetical protein [Gammaproteobacteria bacterium]